MPRKTKIKIKLNDSDSLQSLMQEVYDDSCLQINDSQRVINELTNTVPAETIDDVTKIAREKSNAMKIKDSAIKLKLESGKLMNEIIKNNGDVAEATSDYMDGGKVSDDDFQKLREIIKNNEAKNKN